MVYERVLTVCGVVLDSVGGHSICKPIAGNYDFNYPDLSTTPTASTAASYQSSLYDGTSYTAYALTNWDAGTA